MFPASPPVATAIDTVPQRFRRKNEPSGPYSAPFP